MWPISTELMKRDRIGVLAHQELGLAVHPAPGWRWQLAPTGSAIVETYVGVELTGDLARCIGNSIQEA